MRGYRIKKYVLVTAVIFSVAPILYLSSIYLPLSYQFIVGWGLLIPMLVIRQDQRLLRKIPIRILFLLISAFISLRYWFWRTNDTLLYLSLLEFIAVMVLYLAESYSICVHMLGMFVNIWPLKRRPIPLPLDTDTLPSVDVFITTYNESEDLVRVTAVAAAQIDYPKDKINIYILDDGGTAARRENPKTSEAAWERYRKLGNLAKDLGVNYIAREKNDHAKAGNINYALKQTGSDLILMLDCDHVPTNDILRKTVGLFLRDKKLFLVQTPHFFINPSPIEKNLSTFYDAPMENEMFYGSIQLGLDFWNSSFFCGSAAILRRRCLDEVGGIAGDTITEDAETALALHSKGYNSAYLSQPMVCGLSPETFEDFIAQRSRWSQGMTQIFILKNPLLKKGLSFYQRMCYTNSCISWFFGFTRIIFYLSPLAFLFFGLKIYNASIEQVLAYAVPHVVGTVVVADFLYGRVRWSFFSELYESIQSIFILPAVVSTMFNPTAPTFKVTPKGKNLGSNFLSSLAAPFYILLILILLGFPAAALRWFTDPENRDVVVICAAWSVYNLILLLACLGVVWEKQYTRKYHRIRVEGNAKVFFPRLNLTLDGKISDLSLGGAGIEFIVPRQSLDIIRGEEVNIESIDSTGEKYNFSARIMRSWINPDKKMEIGIEYRMLEDKETFARHVKYFYGDSRRWHDFRDERLIDVGFWGGMVYFVRVGAKGGMENLKGLINNYLKPGLANLLWKKWKGVRIQTKEG